MRCLTFARTCQPKKPLLRAPVLYDLGSLQKSVFDPAFRKAQAAAVYAVDDMPYVTELYEKLLVRAG